MKSSTERDYHRRIARVIEAILVDPGAHHTVESLAAVAHLSPFHFHRIYRALAGESIAETVQRLRLACAAHRLTDAANSVTSIALTVGYESPQAFARAFRGFAGVSPSEFKARQRGLTSPGAEAPAPERPGAGRAGAGWPLVELTALPPIDALCLRHHGPIATISHTFRRLLRTLSTNGVSAALQQRIGICSGDPGERDGLCYLAGNRADDTDRAGRRHQTGARRRRALCRPSPGWSLCADRADIPGYVRRLVAAQRL